MKIGNEGFEMMIHSCFLFVNKLFVNFAAFFFFCLLEVIFFVLGEISDNDALFIHTSLSLLGTMVVKIFNTGGEMKL